MKSILVTIVMFFLVTANWPQAILAQCILTIPPNSAGPSPIGGVVCPQGDGTPAAEAWLLSAAYIETITAVILAGGDPIENYPFEDMWLEFEDFCNCTGDPDNVYADFNSDANGATSFTAPVSAGSCLSIPTIRLVLAGAVCATSSYNLNIQFRSVDLNCDGIVNEPDKDKLKELYLDKEFCGDLNNDGQWTPHDVAILASHYFPSHHCP